MKSSLIAEGEKSAAGMVRNENLQLCFGVFRIGKELYSGML